VAHQASPRIFFGEADGSQGLYTPCTSLVLLKEFTPDWRMLSARDLALVGKTYGGAPADGKSITNKLRCVLHVRKEFIGHIHDLVHLINQMAGPANTDFPKNLWYADDVNDYATIDNTEAASTTSTDLVTVEFTYDGDGDDDAPFAAGDFAFVAGGSDAHVDEIVVVEAVNYSIGTFTCYLEEPHYAGAQVFKIGWGYPNARLESARPSPSHNGRCDIQLDMTPEGEPKSGTELI